MSKFLSLLCLLPGIKSFCQDYTVPGKISVPYPTLINLGVEWNIKGDDNQNGVVTVKYRKKGTAKWLDAMNLRRVPAGKNNTASSLGDRQIPGYTGYEWTNKHAGSIFDLEPGTSYEILLSMNDPDGGSVVKRTKGKTRQIPLPQRKSRLIEIAPGDYDTLHTVSGSKYRPVVYRCKSGRAVFKFIDVRNRKWVFIQKLEVRNLATDGIAVSLDGSENCAVTGCVINAVYGIVAYKPGATNCYFSDNVLNGVCSWNNISMGAMGDNVGEGIQVTGPGNVICYNRVSGFRDCISFMEDEYVVNQTCIDVYNNDILNALDDAVEADFSFSNCRVMRNRITNAYVGLSSQPGLGGPTYFIRNVMYNVIHAAFKLKRFSIGDVVLHNTVVKIGTGLGGNSKMDHAWFRNNLAVGGPSGDINWGGYGAGIPAAANVIEPGEHSSFDYDAIGVYASGYSASIGGQPFSEVEKNGVEHLEFNQTFRDVDFPYPPVPGRSIPDLRLKPGSKAIDAGMYIPNVNSDFSGKAPDCGAYESEQELPHYGPRNRTN
ncbi:MAG: right-handed parallel beta-helix repeat-containing protein [Ginsengibacter sp.]